MIVDFNAMFIFQLSAILLSTTVSCTQESNPQELRKPIDGTATVACTECENDNTCVVIVNSITVDNYALLQTGNLMLPPNDPNTYGTVQCGSTVDHLAEYLICPPNNGQYDWVHIESSATTVTMGNTWVVTVTFSQLPHSGISLRINQTAISSDDDITCIESNDVRGKVVNYLCSANCPSTKQITAQLTFCDIEFISEALTITISAPQSTSTSTTTDSMTSSSMIASSSTVSSTTSASSGSFSTTLSTLTSSTKETFVISTATESSSVAVETGIPTDNEKDDNGPNGGQIAAITITAAIIFIIGAVIVIIVIYLKYGQNPERKVNAEGDAEVAEEDAAKVEALLFCWRMNNQN